MNDAIRIGAAIVFWSAWLIGAGLCALLIANSSIGPGQSMIAGGGCLFREGLDCETLQRGEYGRLMSVPLPWWGLGFYALAAAAWAWGRLTHSRAAKTAGWYVLLAGVCAGVHLIWLMASLGRICDVCLSIHAANLALVAGWAGMPCQHASSLRLAALLPRLVFCAAIVAVLGWLHRADFSYADAGVPVAAVPEVAGTGGERRGIELAPAVRSESSPPAPAGEEGRAESGPPADLVLGDGSLEVLLFIDFTCPDCRRLSRMLTAVRKEEPDLLRVRVRLFPLESACNAAVEKDRPEHRGACEMARLAYDVTADNPAAFAEYYLALTCETGQSPADARKLALRLLGGRARREVFAGEVEQRLQADIDLAIDYGVEALPAMIVSGKKYEGVPRDQSELLRVFRSASRNE